MLRFIDEISPILHALGHVDRYLASKSRMRDFSVFLHSFHQFFSEILKFHQYIGHIGDFLVATLATIWSFP